MFLHPRLPKHQSPVLLISLSQNLKALVIAANDWAPNKYFELIYDKTAHFIFLYIMQCLHNQTVRSVILEGDLFIFN